MNLASQIVPGRYAVIGGSGLIGTHFLAAMANQPGVKVTAISCSRTLQIEAPNIRHVQLDGLVPGAFDTVLKNIDIVVCCAGVLASTRVLDAEKVNTVFTNIKLSINIIEAIHKAHCSQVIWISSTTGFPESSAPLTELQMFHGDPPAHWFGIGWSYRFFEKQCAWLTINKPNALSVTILRPTMVYGEYQDFSSKNTHFLPSFIKSVVNRECPIALNGAGEIKRELIYAGDVARAIVMVTKMPIGFRAYNISGGTPMSLAEYLDMLIEIDGFKNPQIDIGVLTEPIKNNLQIDCSLAFHEIGFKPQMKLAEGLERLISWYRKQRHLSGR